MRKGSSLLVAVSGGGDSTALLHILYECRETLGISRLAVIHVNHRLRGDESDDDERFVASLAGRLSVPFYHKKLSGRSLDDKGMEAWAREERYRFFHTIRKRGRFTAIATGHTADDQAETVLHRLLRGCGLRGLRGILARREDGVVRPLLGVRRRDLLRWLEARRLPYRTDSTNASPAYLRNRIRHELLPGMSRDGPRTVELLCAIARTAQAVHAQMEPAVSRWISRFTKHSRDRWLLDTEGLSDELHAAEALRALFDRYGIDAGAQHIEAVIRNRSRTAGTFLLPGGSWRYFPTRGAIEFSRGESDAAIPFQTTLSVPGTTVCRKPGVRFVVSNLSTPVGGLPADNRTVMLDRDACGTVLTFRSWRGDDRFHPLGSERGIGVGLFLAKQKVPKRERSRCGVVEGKKGMIVWIPGIRISQRARITDATRGVLKISYQSCPSVV